MKDREKRIDLISKINFKELELKKLIIQLNNLELKIKKDHQFDSNPNDIIYQKKEFPKQNIIL